MRELDEDRRRPVPGADPSEVGVGARAVGGSTTEEQATDDRAPELTAAAARLHEAIEELNRAFLGGSAVAKDSARDGFDVALAAYAALLDAS